MYLQSKGQSALLHCCFAALLLWTWHDLPSNRNMVYRIEHSKADPKCVAKVGKHPYREADPSYLQM